MVLALKAVGDLALSQPLFKLVHPQTGELDDRERERPED
jgi:hypothetical protein